MKLLYFLSLSLAFALQFSGTLESFLPLGSWFAFVNQVFVSAGPHCNLVTRVGCPGDGLAQSNQDAEHGNEQQHVAEAESVIGHALNDAASNANEPQHYLPSCPSANYLSSVPRWGV